MVLPDSDGVPRAPPYSGTNSRVLAFSPTRLSRSSGVLSMTLRLKQGFLTRVRLCHVSTVGPTTPIQQRRQAITSYRFRLHPVRSPLLGVSRLISFPLATEMFHFTRSSAHSLCIQLWLRLLQTVVTLFGDPRVITLDHSSPRLIAVLYVLLRTFHLGIHHVPLSTSKTKLRVSA